MLLIRAFWWGQSCGAAGGGPGWWPCGSLFAVLVYIILECEFHLNCFCGDDLEFIFILLKVAIRFLVLLYFRAEENGGPCEMILYCVL